MRCYLQFLIFHYIASAKILICQLQLFRLANELQLSIVFLPLGLEGSRISRNLKLKFLNYSHLVAHVEAQLILITTDFT